MPAGYKPKNNPLCTLGISDGDAAVLRWASRALHSWFESECGTTNAAGVSMSIERDENTGIPYRRVQYRSRTGEWIDHRRRTLDWENGARKRIAAVMSRYPLLSCYVQSDPRGAALYILRPGDVPEGGNPSAYYSRGIAVG